MCGATCVVFNDWCAISYMFQDDRLLPWRSAIRNIEFALEAGSMPRAERAQRAAAALELVDLAGFEEASIRWHAQPGGAGTKPRHRTAHSAHGRAVLAAGCADTRADA
jgi:ABC-type taurine transport system ATPase subunit